MTAVPAGFEMKRFYVGLSYVVVPLLLLGVSFWLYGWVRLAVVFLATGVVTPFIARWMLDPRPKENIA